MEAENLRHCQSYRVTKIECKFAELSLYIVVQVILQIAPTQFQSLLSCLSVFDNKGTYLGSVEAFLIILCTFHFHLQRGSKWVSMGHSITA